MSTPKKLAKIAQKLLQQILQLSRTITKKLMNWLLRGLFVLGRSSRPSQVGFVLPTVVMVTLVVTLLVTAIMIRSFDRAKNASNIRVSERVVIATSPAIDRANAKLKGLLSDPTLPRGTPTDQALYAAMSGSLQKYTFGDETPLKLVYDIDNDNTIETPANLDENEALTTAWRFAVDTDGNGRYDSYSLYGVYFRNPSPGSRARSPLEARTPPMDNAQASRGCGGGTSAALVGSSGWTKTSDGNLRKSFYIFAATVPITDLGTLDATKYEPYQGNKGFAALEVQQDQARIPLTNNAVVYEDDLEITAGAGIRLNGRVITNGNLLVSQPDNLIRFYQVSSINSCYYSAENGKITVGGNVVVGSVDPSVDKAAVTVDLFKEGASPSVRGFGTADASVANTHTATKTSFNSKVYADRIAHLAQTAKDSNLIPPDVAERVAKTGVDTLQALQDYFKERTRRVPFAETDTTTLKDPIGTVATNDIRPPDEWIYPVKPPPSGDPNNGLTLAPNKPPATDPSKITGTDESLLGDRLLVGNGLPSQWWNSTLNRFVNFYDKEPQPTTGFWSNPANGNPTTTPRTRMTQMIPLSDLGDTGRDGFWERNAAAAPKQALADAFGGLRVVTGAGVYSPWDQLGTLLPRPKITNLIADDPSTLEDESKLDEPSTLNTLEGFPVVWPDTMPMWEDDLNKDGIPQVFGGPGTDRKGDLVTRATAVYHYRSSSYDPASPDTYQKPIACVSSYYNPSTARTAKNREGLPDISLRTTDRNLTGLLTVATGSGGLSNNGVSYTPDKTAADITAVAHVDGLFTFTPSAYHPGTTSVNLSARLAYQANLIFPNGRFVNEPLRKAMKKLADPTLGKLTLAEQSAIDSTICALQIADGTLNSSKISDAVIPHGAIYETTFLDPRQVKGIESETPATAIVSVKTDYDLDITQRQPLEIRATVIDLDLLRRKEITGTSVVPTPEYLLPDSGIIYASRDDALPDLSVNPNDLSDTDYPTEEDKMAARRLKSPVDFLLDPNRRPNGIMLINGSKLARGGDTNNWKQTERGLILATNVPAYVKADASNGFNLHQKPNGTIIEEFAAPQRLRDYSAAGEWSDANFYTDRTEAGRDSDFACRKNQPGLSCSDGDLWRPATVLADSVTLLSNNFRFGFRDEGDFDLRKNVDNLANSLVVQGYDINGNGINAGETIDETTLGFDVNGVPGNQAVPETQITITGVRRLNGFFDNNYLTSANWVDPSTSYPKDFDGTVGAPVLGSSYVNNFVTPIQRRTAFPEYVMEICRKPLVEQCGPNDWVVNINDGADTKASLIPPSTTADQLRGTNPTTGKGAGTTARFPLNPAEQRYPRRVAFRRDPANNQLVLDANRPIPLGINLAGNVAFFPYSSSTVPAIAPTGSPALWFRTTNGNNPADPTIYTASGLRNDRPLFYQKPLTAGRTQQPLLVPVLQLHFPTVPASNTTPTGDQDPRDYGTWLQKPVESTWNLIIATGDNPARDADATALTPAEQNGGMPNLPIFLENWYNVTSRISGSFIQYKRSTYATAPFLSVLKTSTTDLGSVLNYQQRYRLSTSEGRSPFYTPPNRQWGYDVGLLSQAPDLFAQQITTPSAGEPNKFYREVGRSDPWVKTLLCAAAPSTLPTGGGPVDYDVFALTGTATPPASDSCPEPISAY